MMDLFERQWQTYRAVVDNDWMEHGGITAATQEAVESWFNQHPTRYGKARLLDLGCGDLAQMAPVFRMLPLGAYVGVDLTEQVLPMARAALGATPFSVDFVHADVRAAIGAGDEPFDLVHASLVLHHLPDDEKVDFLVALRPHLSHGGAFVWADVFREPGESRSDYVARYAARIRRDWLELPEDEREAIVTHMSTFDFPADREEIVTLVEQAGWNWRWLWKGHHQAEAVALLTLI